MTRTRIRSRDLRLSLPNDPAVDADERALLLGRYFEGTCVASDAAGDFVHISGAVSGSGLYTVAKCDPLDASKMPAVGVIVSKSSPVRCFVQALGELETTGGMVPGARMWIGLDSQLDDAPPPGALAIAQVAGVALSGDTLLMSPSFAAGSVELAHRTLRHAIHFIDHGPGDGFASGAFMETTPAGPFPGSQIWYTSAAKTDKIVELTIARSANKTIASKTWLIYDIDGATVLATIVDTITRSGIFETSRTRAIS